MKEKKALRCHQIAFAFMFHHVSIALEPAIHENQKLLGKKIKRARKAK